MEKAIRELRIHLAGRRRLQPETSVYPYDLYQCWMGDNYPDQVYYDEERTQKAFSHHAGQWQFYKGGSFLYTTFFIDWRRKPFLALSAQQQDFVRGYRILSISPHFSFDAARR